MEILRGASRFRDTSFGAYALWPRVETRNEMILRREASLDCRGLDKAKIWWPLVGLASMAVYPYTRIAANNLGFTVQVSVVLLWILGVAGVCFAIVGLGEFFVRGSSARIATFLIPWVWLVFNFHFFAGKPSPHLLWIGTTAAVGAVMVIASRSELTHLLLGLWAVFLVAAHLIPVVGYVSVAAADEVSGYFLHAGSFRQPNVWVFVPDGYTSPEQVEDQAVSNCRASSRASGNADL